MGKKARQKRDRATATDTSQFFADIKHARRNQEVADGMRQLEQALADEKHNREADRLNNLPIGHPDNVHKLALTFDPIEHWMDTMVATGEIDVIDRGLAIFRPRSEEEGWYPVVESFLAVSDTYELIAAAAGVADESGALRRLANKIHVDMPVFQPDIDAAKAAIAWMKKMTAPLTPAQFSEYTVAIQIRATMATQRAA